MSKNEAKSKNHHKHHDAANPPQDHGAEAAHAHAEQVLNEAQPDQSESLKKELEQALAERDHAKDQLLRTLADLQNFRKRVQQEKDQLRQFATEQLVRDLLPVLDNFERTIAAAEQGATLESLLEGVRAVDRQLRTALESQRVQRIAAKGSSFDPEFHEAIATEETHELPEGTILHEVEAGYRMADRVIRPARVRVAKKP